jgi:hypothetical protein
VVEHLPSNCETFSSNPSAAKKKKKKERNKSRQCGTGLRIYIHTKE